MKKTVWNWVQVVVLALVGLYLWTGCRTVYVNSVHNQRTGGAVSTEMKEQKAETTADFGKTVTTNAEVPLQ